MSKQRRKPSSKKTNRPSRGQTTVKRVPGFSLKSLYPAPPIQEAPIYRKMFWGSSAIALIIMIFMAWHTGVNGDDYYQVQYSEAVTDYYLTFGADSTAVQMKENNLYYYGGFFELLAGLTNRALGLTDQNFNYFRVRHLLNVVFGWGGMIFAALMIQWLAGWRLALWTFLLLFVSPRFLGHAIMNPKDIPFAAAFALFGYGLFRLLRSMPNPGWKNAAIVAAGIGIAIGTRAGGILLIAYLGMFMGLDFLMRGGFQALIRSPRQLGQYAGWGAGIAVMGYLLGILFWPAALIDPIGHPREALDLFSKYSVKIRVLFEGINYLSDSTPWYYLPKWMLKTIPLVIIGGFLLALATLPMLWRKYAKLPLAYLFFASVFPVCYIIYKESDLYDGWRHVQFAYPSMVGLAALAWGKVESLMKPYGVWSRYLLWTVLAIGMLLPASFIARNPYYPYVYFNPIGGGLQGALGWYETDYWGLSTKQAVDWLAEQGVFASASEDPIRLGTTFSFNVGTLAKEYGYRTVYTRVHQRYMKDWDYGIYPSRFLRGEVMRAGIWPNSRSIHLVTASGVPLCAIEHEPDRSVFLGEQARREGRLTDAISHYQAELAKHPDNDLAMIGLADAYINTNQIGKALETAQQAVTLAPGNETASFYLGWAYLRAGRVAEAKRALQQALEYNPQYTVAHFYMAVILQQEQRLSDAMYHVNECLKYNSTFKQAYLLGADILEAAGQPQDAADYRARAARLN